MRTLAIVFALAVLAAAGAWVMAGRAEGPVIEVTEPAVVGQTGRMSVAVDAPGGALTRLEVHLEQEGTRTPLFVLSGENELALNRVSDDRVVLSQPLGKREVPELRAGAATLVVTAARPVLFGYREAETVTSREFEVRLAPPQ